MAWVLSASLDASLEAILFDRRLARNVVIVTFLFAAAGAAAFMQAQSLDSKFFTPLRWRMIGPFRGGRVSAVAGVPGQPNVYYFGTPGGGAWKTIDGGHTWRPIFDDQPVAGIGALAVAPSDPNVIYVGTGETAEGNGVYRSNDAGATWSHAGLEDTRYIQAIIVDPHNPNIAIAGSGPGRAILGRQRPNAPRIGNRGVFKTTDGGKTWSKTLGPEETAGVVDLCADPNDARKLYAVLFRPAGGKGDDAFEATSEIYVSNDEGSSWKELVSHGLPATGKDAKKEGRGRLGIAVAPGNHGHRLYAIMDQGFYRSDDGGSHWERLAANDPRIVGNAYFSRVFVDPQNPDVLYVSQTSMYRSTDGGHSFQAFTGAPSGDDFHLAWIDPQNPQRMLLGVDQGAIITVNGGQTWGSWYNQPTGEFYHVSTDNTFPYHVFGAQQDSGTASVASRSDYGEITDREFLSIGGFEYCYIVADPLNPNLIYSGGWYGTLVRFDKTNGQLATVFEPGDRYRSDTVPIVAFSPHDPHTLFMGTQFVMKTSDAGKSWKEISPDLTGYVEPDPKSKSEPAPDAEPPGAITALALSPVEAGVIWAGTSNRIVQVTRDGGTSWQIVSPPALSAPQRILSIDASHSVAGGAYVVVGSTRESAPPYIARTRDFGRSWQQIGVALPLDEMARVVREDPARPGLLYAGTEKRVYVSLDDGDHWQALQQNMPVVRVTDLDVHGNDLVASTYGRALWILDDLSPIREMSAGAAEKLAGGVYLFPPAPAIRVRWDNFQDTPYPPETPAGKNPPDGAVLDYFLKTVPAGEITMTVLDDRGREVRRYSSAAVSPNLPLPNVPDYWFAPLEALPKAAGLNRFVWDLRYPPPMALPYSYYGNLLGYTEYTFADHAVPGETPREQPQGPLVVPGNYVIELSVAGKSVRQPLVVKPDPRLTVSAADLQAQLDLMQQIARGMAASYEGYHQVETLRAALKERQKKLDKNLQEAAEEIEKKLDAIDKGTKTAPGFGPANRDLTRLASSAQSADTRPADTVRTVVEARCKSLDEDFAQWRDINARYLAVFNGKLGSLRLPLFPVAEVLKGSSCGP
jgi:photosystem II stability/assembly factor-like uncharacterized protein